jgi:hypothetical protein
MVNKSLGEVAYNIIDIEGDVSQAVKDSIVKVNGVMGVRVL